MNEQSSSRSLIELRVYLTTIVILGLLIIAAGAASYLIPAGRFVETDAVARVYQAMPQAPIPVWKIILAPLLCITGSNGAKVVVLVLFILLIGGSFSILNHSGVLPAFLSTLAKKFSSNRKQFLVANVILFSLLGSNLGILEEIVPMILIFVPLARRMGWDSMTGIAIPFLSAGFGFSAAMFNPFTVGTAQKLADVALFSGLELRFPLYLITTTLVIVYLLRYTKSLEADPGVLSTPAPEEEPADEADAAGVNIRIPASIIAVSFGLIAVVVLGGIRVPLLQDLAFPLIALIFLCMGFGVGFASGCGAKNVFRYFLRGLGDFAPAILLVLMASSVSYLVETGSVMDTILYRLSGWMGGMGKVSAAFSLYFFQMFMNFFVPSGSGQAFLTIPILAPLGDLVGVSRQTVVLAYQCGDGFSNLIWPTNPMLLIAIGLAGVSYRQWFRFILPLQLALAGVCMVFLWVAVVIGYA